MGKKYTIEGGKRVNWASFLFIKLEHKHSKYGTDGFTKFDQISWGYKANKQHFFWFIFFFKDQDEFCA